MRILRGIYTIYGVVVFAILFFMFFPALLIPIVFKKKFHLVGIFNRWWARSLFFLVGLPVDIEYRAKLDPRARYIFCSNHFSYLDIPTLGLNRHNTIFVGKSAMEKIPLFGFMYRHLHITVDRSRLKSRYSTLKQSLKAVDEGKSLNFYPEGGIISTSPPHMSSFKDGAFRVAIEKHIPIVPVTIPYNWIILPDNEFLLRWHPIKVIFHEPIAAHGLTLQDIDKLKKKVYSIIDTELKKQLANENYTRAS